MGDRVRTTGAGFLFPAFLMMVGTEIGCKRGKLKLIGGTALDFEDEN